jgi:hypothetical protein
MRECNYSMGMREAREGQPEVIEPVIERLTCDRDAKPAHVGEVGQAYAAGAPGGRSHRSWGR